jgi:hypothetical protein
MSKLLGGVISELVFILLNLDFKIDQSWTNLRKLLNDIHIPTRAKYYLHSNSCRVELCYGMCPFEFWKKFKNDLLPILFASLTQKILACITPLRNMHPSLIYPQLPHLHNHGLAMLACITPFRNMRPPPVYWSHLKRSFWRSDFLLKYQQNPSRDGAKKKKREKEE